MTARRTRPGIASGFTAGFLLLVWMTIDAPPAGAQASIARAKELYASASYDEALTVLEQLEREPAHEASIEIAQYRVFCLLALDRSAEARQVIEAMITLDPFYRPSDAQTPPRIRGMIDDVRKALLPVIVRNTYAQAKAAFDRKDAEATRQFERVLALLDDPDMANNGPAADLRTVATGFRDLSKAVAAAQAPPAPSEPAPARPTVSPAPEAAPITIVPPTTLSQPLPRWTPSTRDAALDYRGAIEVSIDERGFVSAVAMRQSVHPAYDQELLRIARTWKYKPATKDGQPIPSQKVVEIQLTPAR